MKIENQTISGGTQVFLNKKEDKPTRDYRNGDFKAYYCQKTKIHMWVLGYFGGGSLNFGMFKKAALDFSSTTGCDISDVNIDEIHKSSRYKYFKYMYSTVANQEPVDESVVKENVWQWLND